MEPDRKVLEDIYARLAASGGRSPWRRRVGRVLSILGFWVLLAAGPMALAGVWLIGGDTRVGRTIIILSLYLAWLAWYARRRP